MNDHEYSYAVGLVVGPHGFDDLTDVCIANIACNPQLAHVFLRHRPDIVQKLPPPERRSIPPAHNSFWLGYYHARAAAAV